MTERFCRICVTVTAENRATAEAKIRAELGPAVRDLTTIDLSDPRRWPSAVAGPMPNSLASADGSA